MATVTIQPSCGHAVDVLGLTRATFHVRLAPQNRNIKLLGALRFQHFRRLLAVARELTTS